MSSKNAPQGHWKQIKCPFFHSDNFNSVNCEGNIENSAIRHIFPNKAVKQEWEKRYCMEIKACTGCPIYGVANEKYL